MSVPVEFDQCLTEDEQTTITNYEAAMKSVVNRWRAAGGGGWSRPLPHEGMWYVRYNHIEEGYEQLLKQLQKKYRLCSNGQPKSTSIDLDIQTAVLEGSK